ncbi:MAG: multi-sensor signal transduction histidine kinase, partial [Nitrospirae bacterium]|nr:multi-sensor signal transduction histidine kinase [Nitrospirota bacterium]
EDVSKRLEELKKQTGDYEDALSRLMTIRANTARLVEEEEKAFKAGETLTDMVNSMIMLTSMKLSQRTQAVLRDVSTTKAMLFILVAIGPLLASGLAFIFIRGYTRPVNMLLEATRKIKTGNLDFRVEGLTDEFGELAGSFNEMAVSLKDQLVRIEESEKRYRMLFEKAGDAIFIVDAEGKNVGQIVNANEAAAAMHGFAAEELMGLNIIRDLDAPSAEKKTQDLIKRILNGEWIKAELEHQKKDGTVFPVEISAGLLEIGTHKYILVFDRDITERKRTEETLQRAEQIKICGEMAVGMAHEIKNPLAGIKVSIEVLLEELNLEEGDREVLVKVINEIKRLELLIKALLNFARPPRPQFSLVNINDILELAASFSLQKPSFSPIKALKDFDEHLPETMADPMQLQQVFMNLILNAAEAMREGGTLTLKTSYDKSSSKLQVIISDTGEGITDEMKEKIFQPFFTTKSKGTGLGLAISKRLIEQHGGNIIAESNHPKGTIFRISFPLVRKLEEEAA